MKQAKIYLDYHNTALEIKSRNDEEHFNKILKKNGAEKFSPDLDDFDEPYPYFVIPYRMDDGIVLLHTSDKHDTHHMGALDICSTIINVEVLEKELV